MPYKYLHEHRYQFDVEKVGAYTKQISEELALERCPVGVKLINTKAEFESLDVPAVSGKLSYCQMVERATRGKTFKSARENHSCDGATTALAMESSTPEIESGETYFSYNLYASKSVARRMRSGIVSLVYPDTKTFGMLTGPLSEYLFPPDLVLFIVHPAHAMRLVQGWEYETGLKPSVNMGAMQAFCSELTVVPLLSGSMNVSVFCPSTRTLSRWGDHEMGVSLPFERFYALTEGVMATSARA
ncbi:MAG: DUF169 domain-containing protein [Spirochaetaceae bacterium]|jgi:uncharacterized protein (DUF169 family)|nr:DUF169 domain-containing protein [Spirochaetaceae bacterium]